MQTETVVAVITGLDRVPGLIDLQSAGGRTFAITKAALCKMGFDCVDVLSVGDRVRFLAKPVVTYQVERVTGLIPKRTNSPRRVSGAWREKASRHVLQHVERARCSLEDFFNDGLSREGVLAHPQIQNAALEIAQEELGKAIAIIGRTLR